MKLKKPLLFFIFFWQASIFSQSFSLKQFNTEQGLPDSYVYSSFQDKNGFLWSATTKGLVKFDGQLFVNYPAHLDEGDFFYSGAVDSSGKMWFGTYSGKIYNYARQGDSLSIFPASLNGSVDRILVSADKQSIYFISKGSGIFILRNNKLLALPFSQIYQLNALVELSDKNLVLATPDGLYSVNVSKQSIKKIKGIESDINSLQKIPASNKVIMAVNGKGILSGEFSLNEDSVSVNEFTDLRFIAPIGVSCFYYNHIQNTFYIAGRDEKLYVYNKTSNSLKTIPAGEFQAIANSIITDTEDNLWISTAGKGLYRFYKEEYDFISINNQAVFAITRDNFGNTYFGTEQGIEVMDKSGVVASKITSIGKTKLGKVSALYFDGVKLWVGTEGSGLMVMDLFTKSTVPLDFSNIENITINAITGNRDLKTVYVATNLDGSFNYKNYQLINHFSVQNSLLHNNVYYALGCKNNHVYYATHNTAINFSRGNEVYEISLRDNGLISDYNTFAESPEGILAIGTNGDGVYFLNDTNIIPMALNNKLDSKFCNALVYDKSGNLWIAQRYGIYKYYVKESILKKVELGLDNNTLFGMNAFFADPNGELLFGTNKNVLVVKNTNKQQFLPVTYIRSVNMFDSLPLMVNNPELANGKYDITFNFSALCLRNSEEVRFSYILEGRDSKWSEPASALKAEFFSLGEGTYTFKVKAINADGFASDNYAAYTLIIKPPFWKNGWFWVLVVLALTGLVMFIVKQRTAVLIKAKLKLEKIVEEKTHELREEKELVEAKNQVIEEQNEDIKASITYAKRIQQAILPDKNLDAEAKESLLIYYKPKDIVSGDFYWISRKNTYLYCAACDCTGHGVPGAFMSLIGSTLLNKIVFDKNENNPEIIMQELDKEISKSLRQEDSEVNDGMEAALCRIDFKNKQVEYCGAKRPLFHIKKLRTRPVLDEYKANKFSIGGFAELKEKQFTSTTIQAAAGDVIYMFSDGVIDQFNGENNKRFSTKRLRQLLVEISPLPLIQQWEAIDKAINDWQQHNKQTDDILILGVRF